MRVKAILSSFIFAITSFYVIAKSGVTVEEPTKPLFKFLYILIPL